MNFCETFLFPFTLQLSDNLGKVGNFQIKKYLKVVSANHYQSAVAKKFPIVKMFMIVRIENLLVIIVLLM